MATLARAGHPADGTAGNLWIHNRRFDLLFLTLSGVLVFFPYISYGVLQRLGASQGTASLVVGLSVTLLVGGPHMYSTYLRTALEPRFRRRYGFLAYLPLVLIPTLVVIGSMYSFLLLLTGFFFWASMHVTHQAQWISETYRRRAGLATTGLDRILDGAVILGALYTMAMYKFVEGQFTLGTSALLFPNFLKRPWVAPAFTAAFAALFLYLRRPHLPRDPERPLELAAARLHGGDGRRSPSSSRSSTIWTWRSRDSTPGTPCSTSR